MTNVHEMYDAEIRSVAAALSELAAAAQRDARNARLAEKLAALIIELRGLSDRVALAVLRGG